MDTLSDTLSQLRVDRTTLKASIREQKYLDALALDRQRDIQRDILETEAKLKYDLALQQDIARESARVDQQQTEGHFK